MKLLSFWTNPDAVRSLLYLVGGTAGVQIAEDTSSQVVAGIVAISGAIHAVEEIIKSFKVKKVK